MVVIVVVIVIILIIFIIFTILLRVVILTLLILIIFILSSRSLLAVPIFALSLLLLIAATSLEPLVEDEVGLVHLLSEHHSKGKERGTALQLVLVIHVSLHVSLTLGEFALMMGCGVDAHPKLGEKLVLEE